MSDANDREFTERVFKAELDEIRKRRAEVHARGLGNVPPPDVPLDAPVPEGVGPTVERDLVGLSLSGGGIRSASFSLGVLQALQKQGIFPHIDYLSTVSGGGWTGSCLSALMREPGSSFPFATEVEKGSGRGSASVRHNHVLEYLRDRASGLVPSGLSGGLGFATRVLRGTLMTLAMMISVCLVPSILIAVLTGAYLKFLTHISGGLSVNIQTPTLLFCIRFAPMLLFASVLCLLLSPLVRTLVRDPKRIPWLDSLPGPMFALTGCVFLFELHAFVSWRAFSEYQSAGHDFSILVGSVLRQLGVALTPGPTARIFIACVAGLSIALRASLSRAKALLRVVGFSLIAMTSLAPLYLLNLYFSVRVFSAYFHDFSSASTHPKMIPIALLGSALILLMDTNRASLHLLFRHQISDLFILQPDASGARYEPAGVIKLSALSQPGSIAPYHLLNAALNLQGSHDPSLRGRNSDFFVFSKHFIGSRRTGYMPTPEMETVVPDVDLATAMTTSAAAAAPNMGTYTNRSVVLLMAFLNLRLGYWLRNPAKLVREVGKNTRTGVRAWFQSFPGGACYFRELLSDLDERGEHVYLSDGGHIENTGAYELLRRRCRYIIVSDAEEDPNMHFGGLAALIRFARLDLGVEIDLDLDDLVPVKSAISRRHSVLARITYPPLDGKTTEHGTLVYLKSSLTGDEHPVIWQYNAENPLFPHESTANQAFGEAQFEAYRALGEHIALGLAGERFLVPSDEHPVAAWFHAIEARIAPTPRYEELFPDLRDEFEEVDTLLRSPEALGYFCEIYPEISGGAKPEETSPAVLHEVVMRQIHLVASVYTQLNLSSDRSLWHPWNRGWIQTFRRWAATPSFQKVWLIAVQSQGRWFRKFCDEVLLMNFYTSWSVSTAESIALKGLTIANDPSPRSDGELYFLGSVATPYTECIWVYSARFDVKFGADRCAVWMSGFNTRAGFEDQAFSQESSSRLKRELATLGLVQSREPTEGSELLGSTLTAEQIEHLRALLVKSPPPSAG